MTGIAVTAFLLGTVFFLAAPCPSAAEVYQYIDESGVIHFTNVPSDPRFKRVMQGRDREAAMQLDHATLSRLVGEASRRYGVEEALIKAIIRAESSFNPYAVSRSGALGLMQLMPETAQRLEVVQPFDPASNIHGGVRHFRSLLDRFEWDLPLALAAYNAGALRVEAVGGIPPFPETRRYVKKVMAFYDAYRREGTPGSLEPADILVRPIYRVTTETGATVFTNAPERYSSPVTP